MITPFECGLYVTFAVAIGYLYGVRCGRRDATTEAIERLSRSCWDGMRAIEPEKVEGYIVIKPEHFRAFVKLMLRAIYS